MKTRVATAAAVALAAASALAWEGCRSARADRLWSESEAAARAGDWDGVAARLDERTRLRRPGAAALRLRAEAATRLGRVDEAVGLLSAVPDDDPMAPAARLQAGVALIGALRLREAEAALRDCLRFDPDADEAQRQLLLVLGVRGLGREYRELLWQVARAPERSLLALLLLAPFDPPASPTALDPAESDEEALLRRWVAADPADPLARARLAGWLREAGRPGEAAAAVEDRPGEPPADTEARLEWIAARIGLGDLDRVAPWLDRLEGPAQSDPRAWTLRGEWLEALRRGDEAVAAYREALRLEPERPWPRFRLAQRLQALGRGDEADAELDYLRRARDLKAKARAIAESPADPAPWLEAARLCAGLGRVREARAWARRYLRARPGDVDAQAWLDALPDATAGP